jgi:hypothetical protein
MKAEKVAKPILSQRHHQQRKPARVSKWKMNFARQVPEDKAVE